MSGIRRVSAHEGPIVDGLLDVLACDIGRADDRPARLIATARAEARRGLARGRAEQRISA